MKDLFQDSLHFALPLDGVAAHGDHQKNLHLSQELVLTKLENGKFLAQYQIIAKKKIQEFQNLSQNLDLPLAPLLASPVPSDALCLDQVIRQKVSR